MIDLAQEVFGDHAGHRSAGHHGSVSDDDDIVAIAQRMVEVVQGDQHGHVHAHCQVADQGQHFDLPRQIQRRGRLIHQQYTGLAHQRLGDRHQLALAAGEFRQVPEGKFGDAQCIKCVVDVGKLFVRDAPVTALLGG